MGSAKSVGERFWEKVLKAEGDGCWLWTRGRDGDGYGMFTIEGRDTRAHRASWELHHGPIPPRLHVLHKCDVPACVRPDHLFLGTHAENMHDKAMKGRTSLAKLRVEDIPVIRARLAAGDTILRLARDYGVSKGSIDGIRRGLSWKHVA